MTYPFAFMGSRVSIHHTCPINRMAAHRIRLGNDVILKKDAYLGVSRPLEEVGEPVIEIDDGCVIHWRSQIDAKNHIHLERDVIVTQDVLIIDHGHAYEDIKTAVRMYEYTAGGRIRIGEGLLDRTWSSDYLFSGRVNFGAPLRCERKCGGYEKRSTLLGSFRESS